MDLRSSPEILTETETSGSKAQAMTVELQRFSPHVICVGLGLLGGAIGVALAIGLAILIQLLLPPPVVFSPGTVPLMVMAILAGLGISRLLGPAAYRILPSLFRNAGEQGLRVILVFSAVTSLLQTLLFARGL